MRHPQPPSRTSLLCLRDGVSRLVCVCPEGLCDLGGHGRLALLVIASAPAPAPAVARSAPGQCHTAADGCCQQADGKPDKISTSSSYLCSPLFQARWAAPPRGSSHFNCRVLRKFEGNPGAQSFLRFVQGGEEQEALRMRSKSGPVQDRLVHLAEEETAVPGAAEELAAFDHDLAAQDDGGGPAFDLPSLPRAVIADMQV